MKRDRQRERKEGGQPQQQQFQKKVWKFRRKSSKNKWGGNGQFYCKNCGLNRTHVTSKCFFLTTSLGRPNAWKRKI
jgi:hypothetical protein